MSFSYDHDIFTQMKMDEEKPKYFLQINNFDKSHVLKIAANQCLSDCLKRGKDIKNAIRFWIT